MGADFCVMYYGIRRPTTPEEMRRLEWDNTSYVLKAERLGLDYRWDGSSFTGEKDYSLFVGREIGLFGWEHEAEKSMKDTELLELMAETRSKLKILELDEEPALFIQWFPDV